MNTKNYYAAIAYYERMMRNAKTPSEIKYYEAGLNRVIAKQLALDEK